MIVIVESNFVLEIALKQQGQAYAEEILSLAEEQKIKLSFPAYALSEPFSKVAYRHIDQLRIFQAASAELKRLETSLGPTDGSFEVRPNADDLLTAKRVEMNAVEATAEQLLKFGTSIPTEAAHIRDAQQYQKLYGLASQDSIVYAAVIAELQRRTDFLQNCFVTRDRKFTDIGIVAELKNHRCELRTDFSSALKYIKHIIGISDSSNIQS